MFKLLSRFFSPRLSVDRATVDRRVRTILTGVERLEGRCMLSLAPASAGLDPEPHFVSFVRGFATVAVSSGAAGSDGELMTGSTGQAPPTWQALEHVVAVQGAAGISLPGIASWDFALPEDANSRFQSGATHAAILPGWFTLPSWVPDLGPATPPYAPPASAADGFVDIGALDQTAVNEPFVGNDANQEHADVLQMLASLRYVPPSNTRAGAVASLFGGQSAEMEEPKASEPPAASPIPTEYAAPHADDAADPEITRSGADMRSSDDSPEGGMVSLVRETVIDESFSRARSSGMDAIPLSSVPVPMDSAHGRFQAFEVSTAEEPSSTAAMDSSEDAPIPPPHTAAGLTPRGILKPWAEQPMPANGVLFAIQQTAGARRCVPPPPIAPKAVQEPIGTDVSGAKALPPSAPVPRDEDTKLSSVAKATAATIAVASAARIVSPVAAGATSDLRDRLARLRSRFRRQRSANYTRRTTPMTVPKT